MPPSDHTSTHIHKRPFQPSTASSFSSSPYQSISTPLLPPSIQSSLLNLGMRIRKSVPEGYKTVPKHNSTASQTLPHSPLRQYNKPQELSPFCGLHKIGDLCSQPPATPISVSRDEEEEENSEIDLPQLLFSEEDGYDFSPASSQESTPEKERNLTMLDPLASTPLVWPSKKRVWDENGGEEKGEDDDVGLVALMEQDHQMPSFVTTSPSYPTHHLRTLAQPKTRRKLFCSETLDPKLQLGGTEVDFAEAAFFNVEEWRSRHRESKMEM
ncbi:MAG: hypothetical protein Q9187_009029 [Circinaria calcarea]